MCFSWYDYATKLAFQFIVYFLFSFLNNPFAPSTEKHLGFSAILDQWGEREILRAELFIGQFLSLKASYWPILGTWLSSPSWLISTIYRVSLDAVSFVHIAPASAGTLARPRKQQYTNSAVNIFKIKTFEERYNKFSSDKKERMRGRAAAAAN